MYQECYPEDAAFMTKKEKKAADQDKQAKDQDHLHQIQKDTLKAVADALVAATVTHHLKQSVSGADESAVSQLADVLQATLALTNQTGGAYHWEQHRDHWTSHMVKVVQKKELCEHVAHIHTQLEATYGEEVVEEVEVVEETQQTTVEEVVVETETKEEEKVEQVEEKHEEQETAEHQEDQKETQETEEKKGDDQQEGDDQKEGDEDKKKDNRPHTAGRRRPDTAGNRGRGRGRGGNYQRNQDDDGFTKVGQEHRGGRGGRGNRGQRGQRG